MGKVSETIMQSLRLGLIIFILYTFQSSNSIDEYDFNDVNELLKQSGDDAQMESLETPEDSPQDVPEYVSRETRIPPSSDYPSFLRYGRSYHGSAGQFVFLRYGRDAGHMRYGKRGLGFVRMSRDPGFVRLARDQPAKRDSGYVRVTRMYPGYLLTRDGVKRAPKRDPGFIRLARSGSRWGSYNNDPEPDMSEIVNNQLAKSLQSLMIARVIKAINGTP